MARAGRRQPLRPITILTNLVTGPVVVTVPPVGVTIFSQGQNNVTLLGPGQVIVQSIQADSVAVSFPEVKVLIASVEAPRPERGSVLYLVSNAVIPVPGPLGIDIVKSEPPQPHQGLAFYSVSTTQIPPSAPPVKMAKVEPPQPEKGLGYGYAGPAIATPSPSFLFPPSVVRSEEPKPYLGGVIYVPNRVTTPQIPIGVVATIARAESPYPDKGKYTYQSNTVVAVQPQTLGLGSLIVKQEFVQLAMGGVLTPTATAPGSTGGDPGGRLPPGYRRKRPPKALTEPP